MVDTLHPPPSVVLSWPAPNYTDPQNRGPALEYICIICSALGVCIVAARTYSRLFITRAPGWDDLLMVMALGFSIAMSVLVIIGNKDYHSGRHIWDIPPSTFVPHRLNIWVSMICYMMAATLVKVSVLLFYRRLSVKFSRAFLVATWIGVAYNLLYLVGFGLALLLTCRPLDAYWEQFDPGWAASHRFHCADEGVMLPVSATLSVLGDVYATLLPLLLILHLDLPWRQKVALYFLFALGFLAVAAGIVRTILLDKLLNRDYDFTWVLWETWIWAVVELYVAIFAASAPALKPYFRRVSWDGSRTSGWLWRSKRPDEHHDGRAGPRDAPPSRTSELAKPAFRTDVERIGYASGGVESSPEGGFMRDVVHHGTRRFELRTSRHGKMIPMQVYGPRVANGPSGCERHDSSDTPPTEDWPMPPTTNARLGPSRIMSEASQHTIHVGLEVGETAWPRAPASPAPGGSVKAARLRAQHRTSHPRVPEVGLNPRQFEDGHDGLGTGSRLESPSDSEGSLYGDDDVDEKPPWNTIKTSSSFQTRDRSDSGDTLRLPRMGSTDFDPERQQALRDGTSLVGYAI